MLYSEKPRAIEAMQLTATNIADVHAFATNSTIDQDGRLIVVTAEGDRVVEVGEYVAYSRGWQAYEVSDAAWFESVWSPVPDRFRIE
jgi:hypothetical protein